MNRSFALFASVTFLVGCGNVEPLHLLDVTHPTDETPAKGTALHAFRPDHLLTVETPDPPDASSEGEGESERPDAGTLPTDDPPTDAGEPDAGQPDAGITEQPADAGSVVPIDPQAACHPDPSRDPPAATLTLGISPDATCWEYDEGCNPSSSALYDIHAEQDLTIRSLTITAHGLVTDYYEDVCPSACGGSCDLCDGPNVTHVVDDLYLCRLADADSGAQVAGYVLADDANRLRFDGLALPMAAGETKTVSLQCGFRNVSDATQTATFTFSVDTPADLQATDADGNVMTDIGLTAGPFPFVTIDYAHPE